MVPSRIASRQLDATDLRMLRILEREGRIPNKALAHAVGVSQATCSVRLRALQKARIIKTFRAELDLGALGRSLEAIVRVQLRTHSRDDVYCSRDSLASLTHVVELFHISGNGDFLVRIAVPDATALHDVVIEQIAAMKDVLRTETFVVLEHITKTVFPSSARARDSHG